METVEKIRKTGCSSHREEIIKELKQHGCRITKQRRIILDVILNGECSCCKDIYYKAAKLDRNIGIATVYRMINTLEEIGEIDKSCAYEILKGKGCERRKVYAIEFDDDTVMEFSEETWNQIIRAGLSAFGYMKKCDVRKIHITPLK